MERVLGIKTHLGIKAGHPQVGWNHNSSGNPGQVVQVGQGGGTCRRMGQGVSVLSNLWGQASVLG